MSVFWWPCEVELTSALHFYLCVGISSPLSQMKRSESFPDHVLFSVTYTFPKLLPVPDEVHNAGFLVQSWFLNYSNYYSMLYFRMTKMTIYQNFWHNTAKGIPFILVTINTLHSVHCSAFLLSVALLWASPLGGYFNKQAITGKSLLCPNCFLSRVVNLSWIFLLYNIPCKIQLVFLPFILLDQVYMKPCEGNNKSIDQLVGSIALFWHFALSSN